MANRRFKQFVLTQDARQVLIAGQINLSAAAAVTSFDIPLVASVTKSDTGEYTITLQDKYVKLRSCQLTYQGTEDLVPRVQATDVSSAKTIVIETAEAGVATDATAACVVHLTLILKDSSAR